MVIALAIGLPIAGLLTWTWWIVAQVGADLKSFNGFEGLHFEI